MLELAFIRHGEAHCNTIDTITRPTRCAGLTNCGRDQAHRLAERFLTTPPVAIYTSTTRRAHDTASILATALALPLRPDERLRPPDPGPRLDGQLWSLARATCPADPHHPDRPLAHDGESWRDHVIRVTDAINDITNTNPAGTVIIVGHSETIAATFEIFLGIPILLQIKTPACHTALTRWQTIQERPNVHPGQRRWALRAHNDHLHLRSYAVN